MIHTVFPYRLLCASMLLLLVCIWLQKCTCGVLTLNVILLKYVMLYSRFKNARNKNSTWITQAIICLVDSDVNIIWQSMKVQLYDGTMHTILKNHFLCRLHLKIEGWAKMQFYLIYKLSKHLKATKINMFYMETEHLLLHVLRFNIKKFFCVF